MNWVGTQVFKTQVPGGYFVQVSKPSLESQVLETRVLH